jgi:hypothetical protein
MSSQKLPTSERNTLLALIGLFGSVLAVTALIKRNRVRTPTSALDFAMLGLATFRMGRLVAFDKVAEPLREPFTKTIPDESGAGETVVAAGHGPREKIGELLSCPICAGTWIAAGLVVGLQFLPGPTRLLMTVMSAIGLAEVLNAATEALTWAGQKQRYDVGDSQEP